jgi:hypothetical protein
VVELGVAAAGGEELVVDSVLNHSAILDHQDLVRGADGAQPVGDDQHGASVQRFGQRGVPSAWNREETRGTVGERRLSQRRLTRLQQMWQPVITESDE